MQHLLTLQVRNYNPSALQSITWIFVTCVGVQHSWNVYDFRPLLCTFWLNLSRRTSWGWRDEWDGTALQTRESKIPTLSVWDRARYFSVTEALRNIEYLQVSREETFCFFETWMPERSSNPRSPTCQAGSFSHCTRATSTLGKWSNACSVRPRENNK